MATEVNLAEQLFYNIHIFCPKEEVGLTDGLVYAAVKMTAPPKDGMNELIRFQRRGERCDLCQELARGVARVREKTVAKVVCESRLSI